MRLVPDMTPAESFAKYKAMWSRSEAGGDRVEVRLIHSGEPIVMGTDNAYVKAATEALKSVGEGDRVYSWGRIDSDCGGF